MNLEWKKITVLVLMLLVVTLTAEETLARAGGGQSYGGGGSGSSGGGDGLGIIVYLLIRLCIEQPCIGIPLVIIIFTLFILAKKRQVKLQQRRIQQAGNAALTQKQAAGVMDAALQNLKARDSGFQQQDFLEKVRKTFLDVQKAWSDQDMSGVRKYVSDGVYERFSLQIHIQKAMGFRNLMDDVTVLGTEINSIESTRHFDSIHVKITASAKDTDVSLETGRKIRNNYTGTFIEYWSFLRKPGVRTTEGKSLSEGSCPNCGATLELSDSGQCSYCDAVVTSGEYDWVLSEITQSIEWSTAESHNAIPGYREFAAADSGFSINSIEDTASVIFWRYIKSYFDGSADPVRKVALAQYADRLENSLQQTADGDSHMFFHDAAVGAVEVQSIIQGSNLDRIQVLIKWSAMNSRISSSGKPESKGPKTIRPQIFTLVRKHGVKTLAERGLHSAHCHGCGAPYSGGDSGDCEYCGRQLNDGTGSWVLESVGPFSGSRINSASVSPVASAPAVSSDILLMAMAGVMYSDGKLEDEEMNMLKSFAEHRGISSEELDTILNTVREQGDSIPAPSNSSEALEILRAMVRMALSDGTIDASEKNILETYAVRAGFSKNLVSSTIRSQRKKMYREVKKAGK